MLPSPPKLGQVYRALIDVPVFGAVLLKAAGSGGFRAMLPKGTRIVIESDLVKGASHVQALPLNYGELERVLVPEKERSNSKYQSYGISINLAYLYRHFVLEKEAHVVFDDEEAQEHWKRVLKAWGRSSGEFGEPRCTQAIRSRPSSPPAVPPRENKGSGNSGEFR